VFSHEALEKRRDNIWWDVEESLVEKQSNVSAVVLEQLCKPGVL